MTRAGAQPAVAVIGAGVIGKRLAAALAGGADRPAAPRLAGVALRGPNVFAAARPDLPYFASDQDAADRLAETGTAVQGGLSALLAAADVVVDCGPSRTGAGRAERYLAAGVPAVFCGGERNRELGPLVHSALNPEAARGRSGTRLPSCNTTALARTLAALGVAHIAGLEATIVKCSTDTDKAAKGVTNGALLAPTPSHHADDLVELVPELTARTLSSVVPMTAGHFIHARIALRDSLPIEAAVERLAEAERIAVWQGPDAVDTSRVKAVRDTPWQDRHELIAAPIAPVRGPVLDLWLSLDNQAITLPETLDVIQLAVGTADVREVRALSDALLAGRPAPKPQTAEVPA